MSVASRSIKIFFIVVALLFLALIAFIASFDANNYKPQIIEQVEKATGRDFAIDGEIVLSVFPWVGLKVENAALGNAAGFAAENFAAIKQLDISINVLPLLKKEVQINTIRLHGLNVSLEVAEDKTTNWADLIQSKQTQPEAAIVEEEAEQKAAPEAEAAAMPLASLLVEGFEFIDAQIQYADRSSNTTATVTELNLTSTAIEFDQPVELRFSARIKNNQPQVDTRLQLATSLTFDKNLSRFDLADFIFTVVAGAGANPGLGITQDEKLELKNSSIQVLMQEQRIIMAPWQIAALGANILADLSVSQFLESPQIKGAIEVQPFNARQLAARAGVQLPEMAKSDALHQVSLKTEINLAGEKLLADKLNISLDGSTLSGWLHVTNLAKQKIRYELVLDQLNLNDYLPPVDEPVAGDTAAAADTVPAAAAATGDENIALPVEMLRQLDIQGDFRIKTLKLKEYDISQLLMSLRASKGDINIKPLSLQMLEGQLSSAVNMNVQSAKPAYTIDMDVKQVQAGPVVNPFLDGVMGDKPVQMQGAVNMTMDVKTSGETVNQLKQAAAGKIVVDMKETRVDGFDPEYFMRSSIAEEISSKNAALSKTITGGYDPREVTVFDRIYSSVNLANGRASTSDFLMDSRRVKVGAEGYADIVKNTLDVTSSIKLPRGKTVAEKMLSSPLYVRVHGPFEALKYDIDKDRMRKSTGDILEREVKEKLEAEKQKIKQEAKEKVKKELKKTEDKLKNKLQDKLKGLF